MTQPVRVARVQTGVRIEKRLLKVLKALAAYLDMSLGDLLEGITLHAFEGRSPFVATTRPSFVPTRIPQPVPQNRQGALCQVTPGIPAGTDSSSPANARPRATATAAAMADVLRKSRRESAIG